VQCFCEEGDETFGSIMEFSEQQNELSTSQGRLFHIVYMQMYALNKRQSTFPKLNICRKIMMKS